MINYANPQGVGVTAMAAPNMGGNVNAQRNAITQALMDIANPPPRSGVTPDPNNMPGGYGPPQRMPPPNMLGPTMPSPQDPLNAAGSMPGGMPPAPGGLMGQARIAPTGLPNPPGQVPPQVMPPTPGSPMPGGPQPSTAIGQAPLVQNPANTLIPPGLNPGSY